MRDRAPLLEYARPAKIRNAVERRVFERTLARTPVRPDAHHYDDLGTPYGGWATPVDLLTPGCVCYSVGAGGDVSYDLALLQRGLTVRSIEPVQAFIDEARRAVGESDRYTTHTVAIAPQDRPVRMEVTTHPGSQSVAAAGSGLYWSDDHVEVPGRTLASLMAELGDEQIHVLKLDIEGLEYDVMPAVDLRALGVEVFSTQLHHNRGVRSARHLIAAVEAQGYHLAAIRPVIKLTFVRNDR